AFDRGNHRIVARHDHIHLEAYQLPCELWKSFGFALDVADLQDDRLPFDIAKLPQPTPERLDKTPHGGWSARTQEPDLRDLGCLLRVDLRADGDDREDKGGDDARSRAHRPLARFAISSIASGCSVVIVRPVMPQSAQGR